jgi:Tfp pilus assembly protein PilV
MITSADETKPMKCGPERNGVVMGLWPTAWPIEVARVVRPTTHAVGRTAAFTIAEVVVAVFVLTIIGVGFYGGLSYGFGVLQTTREDLRATQVLMQKLESIRLCTWSELTNAAFLEAYNPLGSTNSTSGTVYTGKLVIGPATNLVNSPSYKNNMSLVTVSVSWTNYTHGSPMVHNRQMQSEVARYGLQNYIWGAIK